MSRIQQDQFIDDEEEEFCPLCVEELDLSDKHFRPCPCGYQICQFCFNNIKTTLSGLCPACRRPYDEAVEWKPITQEEMDQYKTRLADKNARKNAARQKELQKREADSLSRRHLAGLRVVQKNLVYVTGLQPTLREDKLLDALRGEDYFGQYGPIVKVAVSKARANTDSVGVYVTYVNKEDAARCIAVVDGSQNGDKTLRQALQASRFGPPPLTRCRAQYGTTKYCSAYLRNETCNNRQCMFLHEPGEENESFTRQDLSSYNAKATQQPSQARSTSTPQPQPPAQSQAPVAAAPENATTPFRGGENSPEPTDANGPALPSHASWAARNQHSQGPSRAGSVSTDSPAIAEAVLSEAKTPKEASVSEKEPSQPPTASPSTSTSPVQQQHSQQQRRCPEFDSLLQRAFSPDVNWTPPLDVAPNGVTEQQFELIKNYPPLFDPAGGEKRRLRREAEAEERRRMESEVQVQPPTQISSSVEIEDNPEGGSLQLGGEPEERQEGGASQHQHAIQPPSQHGFSGNIGLGQNFGIGEDLSTFGLNGRGGLTQQHQHQQQQLLLQQFRSGNTQSPGPQNAFQNQSVHASQSGHGRHQSRYNFANDASSASNSLKPVANARLMNQQAAMMPQITTNHFPSGHQHQSVFPTSAVQHPPPGLKTTGTPPVTGGGMFGQGHGFATAGPGYGANVTGRSPNANEEMMQNLFNNRGRADGSKRELLLSLYNPQHSQTSTPAPAPGLFPFGAQPGSYHDSGTSKQKKKGKKHRHANTSSSGGGGLVDVTDPSILQARLHQGGGIPGQGLYAGQGQGAFQSAYPGNYGGRW
ncbi:hypothetical protein K402DRAFT_413592 [Aulographum hederae CBS 113979]|uniref:RING-type domain-containing protein n=1 Tax=Aulographum hederae CBS 113979 TaxID=1176131 RepID=A0A6G1GV96_9PEZI|nr:hypothetical protein K402DRAFT_413592 [Aulographum hederae CBS 113979]